MNLVLIFLLTLGDALGGCLQVTNLLHRRHWHTFLTSLFLATCKISAVLLAVKATNAPAILAYVAGATLGGQLSLFIRRKENKILTVSK